MLNSTELLVTTLKKWLKVFSQRAKLDMVLFAKEKQLSHAQIGALFLIRQQSTCGISDIGEHLCITSAAASQLAERLVQQGLIERKENPDDRRAKLLTVTDKGRQVLTESNRIHLQWVEGLVETLSPAEQAQVTAALQLLLDHIKNSGTVKKELYGHSLESPCSKSH